MLVLFSPSLSTFTKAIKNGNFITWPGINDLNFKKLLGTTMATEQGHLDQERKNLQTTSNIPSEDNTSSDNDFFPSKITHKTLNYSFKIINNEAKEKSYTDLTFGCI